MDTDIRLSQVTVPQRHLLVEMYDRFEPLGAAQGLPPRTDAARREWIERALDGRLNLAAFSPAGEAVGHCFLVAGKPGSAELAVFVRRQSRNRGVGRALVTAALDWSSIVGLQRVWCMTAFENTGALCLLTRCGFRLKKIAGCEVELEIGLPAGQVLEGGLGQLAWLEPPAPFGPDHGREGR